VWPVGHMLLIIDVDDCVLTKGNINIIHDSWFSCNFSYYSTFLPCSSFFLWEGRVGEIQSATISV
jgi:hypothetical protein